MPVRKPYAGGFRDLQRILNDSIHLFLSPPPYFVRYEQKSELFVIKYLI